MKNLLLFVFAVFTSTAGFFPGSTQAQSNKPIAAKPIVSKPSAEKSFRTHTPSSMEQAVLDEINAARKNPQKYIKYLEDYKKSFKGKTVYLSKDLLIETVEGTASIDEAIGYLKKLPALGSYNFSDGLNKAAARQLKDLIADSSIGHIGKDGSDLPARIRKFGAVSGKYAENIAYYAPTPRDVVLAMIIDDGIKNRSHRKNIFSPNFKIVGIAFGKSKSSPGLCVVNFAERFYETNTKSGVRQF